MFGTYCPTCPDFLTPVKATSAKFSVEDPQSGEATQAEHTGPTVIAPEGHIMVVHRGLDAPVIIKSGEMVSLCEGDVVRVLSDPDK